MKTVTQLALANNRANKNRSILITISIVLTTMLLTVIAVWGNGLVRTQKFNAGEMYGTYYGRFRNIDQSQIQEMNRRSEFDKIGKTAYVGEVESQLKMAIWSTDETARELANMDDLLVEGGYPDAETEITAQRAFFKEIGYPDVQIGDRIRLNYRTDSASKYKAEEFVVSGILQENELQKNGYTAYISESCYERGTEEGKRRYTVSFSLNDSVQIDTDNYEEVIQELAGKIGIDKKRVSVNSMYLFWMLDPGTETIVVCAGIALIVILFSVIVIYNIFQVGITQKIQEYGKLKAIGMTRRQLRQVIHREGMSLAMIGIPLGLVLGYILSVVSFGFVIEQAQAMENMEFTRVSLFSVPMLLTAAVLAVVTVWTALQKPMRIVSSISPIEAVRYRESRGKRGNGIRRGKESIGVRGLMSANLSENRGRTVMTIFTMGLSCVLFVVMANLVGNMDEEYEARSMVLHGEYQIELDYSMNDTAYPENNLENILKDNPIGSKTEEKIRAIEGVTEVRNRKIFIIDVEGYGPMTVSVLDREEFGRVEAEDSSLFVDYEKAVKENSIFYGASFFLKDAGLEIGQKLNVTLPDGRTWETSIQGASGPVADTDWLMTDETFRMLNLTGDNNGYLFVDCAQKDLGKVQEELSVILADAQHIEISTYQDAIKMAVYSIRIMKLAVYAFLFIIGLIGFMNLANTMIINVITRRQEFGVLQAVGMTNAQLNRMLQSEGLLFTAGTVLVAVVFGIPLGYGLFCYGKSISMYGLNHYHFPVAEITVLFVVLLLLQLMLSYILSRNIKKDSLVERIRYQG